MDKQLNYWMTTAQENVSIYVVTAFEDKFEDNFFLIDH